MSTQVKRPILLQVKSLHDACSQSTSSSRDQDEPPPSRSSRPTKTQSLVLPSPSCQTPDRASLMADFGQQLRQYYSSSKVSNPKKSSPTEGRFSLGSSSSSSSASSSASNSTDSTTADPPEAPSLILPYLYVGDQAQTQIDTISNLNISYILSLQSLPKFLSNSDSNSTSANQPTVTTTTTPVTREVAPPSASRDHNQHHHHHQQRRLSRQDNIDLPSASAQQHQRMVVSERKRHLSSSNELYDIIDGGDGCLLPSMNSSKDYLVKIKPLDGAGSDVEKKQIIEHVPLETGLSLESNEEGVQSDDGEEDDDDNDDEDKDEKDFNAEEGETVCDNHLMAQTQAQTSSNRSNKKMMDINDDELMNGIIGNSNQKVKTQKCPGAFLRQTLERRCNKLSSSVHRLIRGKCINISDTFETLVDKFFDETHSFIEEARRNKCNVLVHCKAGISRSPTIAIAYLMKWKRLHLQDAYNFVKRCRPQISPNLNFMGQLVSYERQLQLVGDGCRLQKPLHFCHDPPKSSPSSSSSASTSTSTTTTTATKKTRTSAEELNMAP